MMGKNLNGKIFEMITFTNLNKLKILCREIFQEKYFEGKQGEESINSNTKKRKYAGKNTRKKKIL